MKIINEKILSKNCMFINFIYFILCYVTWLTLKFQLLPKNVLRVSQYNLVFIYLFIYFCFKQLLITTRGTFTVEKNRPLRRILENDFVTVNLLSFFNIYSFIICFSIIYYLFIILKLSFFIIQVSFLSSALLCPPTELWVPSRIMMRLTVDWYEMK